TVMRLVVMDLLAEGRGDGGEKRGKSFSPQRSQRKAAEDAETATVMRLVVMDLLAEGDGDDGGKRGRSFSPQRSQRKAAKDAETATWP
ncbi:MAG: hypothetical protein WAN60_13945, partial [Candidatus Sulfotelmatobacter sp.]